MDVLVRNITLIDTRNNMREQKADLRIENGRITEVAAELGRSDTESLDFDGMYALPGLVNSHDHLYSIELRDSIPALGLAGMRSMIDRRTAAETLGVMIANGMKRLNEGIVVERDLAANHGLNIDLAGLTRAGVVPGPVVIAAGRPVVMTGGHIYHLGTEVDGPWACRRAVRELAKQHAGVVKIMLTGGLSRYPDEDFNEAELTLEEVTATVEEAKLRSIPTCAHSFGANATKVGLDAGVGCIEHGVVIAPADIERMRDAGTGYVPTASNMRRVAEIARDEALASGGTDARYREIVAGVLDPHQQTIRAAIAAGVKIGIGTDSTGDYSDELRIMRSLGMSAEQVIRAATIDGAQICNVKAGVLEPGALGSVLLYDVDPREDTDALTRPRHIVHRGVLHSDDSWRTWGINRLAE